MDDHGEAHERIEDEAPGVEEGQGGRVRAYVIGLFFAALLTGASFWAAETPSLWGPSAPVLLATLAIAQMGVHLVFFLHIASAPDQTNNFLALAFGILVVGLVVFGSIIIMGNLDTNMMPTDTLIQKQR